MKAVIPVAGLGTRMLPATKAIPKEMLPIVDKPLIQYIVHEAALAGIEEIVFVTHSSKNSIENHFDTSFELEATLEKRVKRQLLDEVRSITPPGVKIMHIRQGEAKGLGHAILCAKPCIGNSPFAILLPDVLINQYQCNLKKDNLAYMIARFEKTGISQVMLEAIPENEVSNYGIADCQDQNPLPGRTAKIVNLVEKPNITDSPSNLSITGRYILSDKVWELLEKALPGNHGEIELTDVLVQLINYETVEGYHIKGKSHDCGSKVGYFEAMLTYALQNNMLRNVVQNVTQSEDFLTTV